MYAVSNAFHQAVRNGNPQMALMIFSDAVFTGADIDVETGITFTDYFNMDRNLKIGQTPSNEISFTLFNDDRLLNDYAFGDFLATIGVYLDSDVYVASGSATLRTGYATYIGNTTAPYLTRNGAELYVEFPVSSLIGYGGRVWVFSQDGRYAVFNDATGENVTISNPVNAFMRNKGSKWNRVGYYYNPSSRMLLIYDNAEGKRYRYEFCPLGWFHAERPNAPDKISINMSCYDLMQRFEQDMPSSDALGITYPTTIGTLFVKMCNYLALEYKTDRFINSEAVIEIEPEDFKNSTMRVVLGWIAEAAASNARIDRDGAVVLDWLKETGQSFNESGYTDFEPYWYTTQKVTKLYNRNTDSSTDTIVGDGDEAYLIQDNPFLR